MTTTNEAVLHWHQTNFVRVINVSGRPSRVILPMPHIEVDSLMEDPSFLPTQEEEGWVFLLRDQDDHGVLHYYAEEPPWATQIRAAMSHMRQQMERIPRRVE